MARARATKPRRDRNILPLLTAAALSLIRWATVEAYYLERENCPDQEYLFYLKHNVRLVRWLEHNRGRVENMLRKALA